MKIQRELLREREQRTAENHPNLEKNLLIPMRLVYGNKYPKVSYKYLI